MVAQPENLPVYRAEITANFCGTNVVFHPSNLQRDVIADPAIEKTVAAGRRFGKTNMAEIEMMLAAMKFERGNIVYAAPTYSLGEQTYKDMMGTPGIQHLIARNSEQPFPHIQIVETGAVIQFRSMEKPKLLRGIPRGIQFLVMDECRDIREEDYLEVLKPQLLDTGGKALLISTFRGTEHWFTKKYEMGQKPRDPRLTKSWKFITPQSLIFQGLQGRQRLEDYRIENLGIWDQEMLCNPFSDNTAVWSWKLIEPCVNGTPYPVFREGCNFLTAWDLGKTEDPSSVVVQERLTGLVTYCEIFPKGMNYVTQTDKAIAICKKYKSGLVIDKTGTQADSMLDFIRSKFPSVQAHYFGRQFKEQMVRQLSLDFGQKKISIPPVFTQLVSQVRAFRRMDRGTYTEYSAPDGQKDDAVAALLMANFSRKQGWAYGYYAA